MTRRCKKCLYLYYLQCGGWWSPLRWSDVGGFELQAASSPSPLVEMGQKEFSMVKVAWWSARVSGIISAEAGCL